jgi:hypothetical protein
VWLATSPRTWRRAHSSCARRMAHCQTGSALAMRSASASSGTSRPTASAFAANAPARNVIAVRM